MWRAQHSAGNGTEPVWGKNGNSLWRLLSRFFSSYLPLLLPHRRRCASLWLLPSLFSTTSRWLSSPPLSKSKGSSKASRPPAPQPPSSPGRSSLRSLSRVRSVRCRGCLPSKIVLLKFGMVKDWPGQGRYWEHQRALDLKSGNLGSPQTQLLGWHVTLISLGSNGESVVDKIFFRTLMS